MLGGGGFCRVLALNPDTPVSAAPLFQVITTPCEPSRVVRSQNVASEQVPKDMGGRYAELQEAKEEEDGEKQMSDSPKKRRMGSFSEGGEEGNQRGVVRPKNRGHLLGLLGGEPKGRDNTTSVEKTPRTAECLYMESPGVGREQRRRGGKTKFLK
jgi:hypothetical protein